MLRLSKWYFTQAVRETMKRVNRWTNHFYWLFKPRWGSLYESFLMPGWWNGRHVGLKIQWVVMPVRVQLPPRVQITNNSLSGNTNVQRWWMGNEPVVGNHSNMRGWDAHELAETTLLFVTIFKCRSLFTCSQEIMYVVPSLPRWGKS